MTLSFRYKSISRPNGTSIKTPSILVILRGGESFDALALLDSGADISAIPRDIAEALQLDLTGNKSSAFGVGGTVDSVETKMEVHVGKGHERYCFNIPVKVILDPYDLPILLGRSGFFDKFVVSFDQSREKVSLKRVR